MVWPNLGVTYKSLDKVSTDIAYFNRIGLNYIRANVVYAPVPWTQGAKAEWRNVAKQFHDAGFHVMWGHSSLGIGVTITSTNWPDYVASTIAEAEYCEANDVCDVFIIANELESFNDGTTITDAQMRSNLRTLATSVKAVFSRPVTYNVEYGSSASSFGTYRWILEGKGDIDLLGANLYGNYDVNTKIYFPRYAVGEGGIPPLNAAFGSEWYISEFNVDATASIFDAMPEDRKEEEMATYLKFIKDSNVLRAYVYQYRAFDDIDAGDSFFLMYSDDTVKRAWLPLVNDNGRKLYEAG